MRDATATRRWLGLIAIALGVALIVVDTTIVNVITPSVVEDLGVNSSQAQWIQESYAIVFAALLLLTGRLSDMLARAGSSPGGSSSSAPPACSPGWRRTADC